MFKKILVPLDGSPFAERVIPLIRTLVQRDGSQISLVRVVPAIGPSDREPGLVSYLDDHRMATAQRYLAATALRLGAGCDADTDARLAPDAVRGILDRASEIDADVILMSSHGESWPDVNRIGATASRIIREAEVPVLVLGPVAHPAVANPSDEGTQAGAIG